MNISNELRPLQNKMMLIVDDSDVTRTMVKRYFSGEYKVVEAASGSEALSILEVYHREISIILLDLIMPGISGYEVVRFMHTQPHYKHIPIIIMTADRLSDAAVAKLAVSSIVTKPLSCKKLQRLTQKFTEYR